MSLTSTLDFVIKKAKLQPNEFGENDILISMVSVYKDGKFLKHAKLNEELLKALAEKGIIKVEVSPSDLQAMTDKNLHLATLSKTLDLEQVPTDQDIINWFKTKQVPSTPVRINDAVIIERPIDYVQTHLNRIKKYGPASFVTRGYISHLTELHSALSKQGWTG